jgi:hypothetical protein
MHRKIDKSRVLLASLMSLLMFVLSLVGCRKFPSLELNETLDLRQISATAKFKSPQKVVSSTALITVAEDRFIRLDFLDVFGLTRMIIIACPKHIVLIDVANRCKSSSSGWLSKLSIASGSDVSLNTLAGWLFPQSWPDTARTFRAAREGNFHYDISIYPPEINNNEGETFICVPEHGIEVSFLWTDQYMISNYPASKAYFSWPDCKDKDIVQMMFER